MLGVTIVADNADLYEAHQHKCDYYDQPAIRDWVSRNVSTISPTFSSVTLNWRGLLATTIGGRHQDGWVERIVLDLAVRSNS